MASAAYKRDKRMTSFAIYALAALAEIGGCYAFWMWFRLGKPAFWLMPGLARSRFSPGC
jgi:drug/metabolite transporter superfamily protein YnfA